MGLFKRKRVDVVDLSDMQKRGLFNAPVKEKDKEGIVDLSPKENTSNPSNEESGNLDFLSNLAGAGSSTGISESPGPITASFRGARQNNQINKPGYSKLNSCISCLQNPIYNHLEVVH